MPFRERQSTMLCNNKSLYNENRRRLIVTLHERLVYVREGKVNEVRRLPVTRFCGITSWAVRLQSTKPRGITDYGGQKRSKLRKLRGRYLSPCAKDSRVNADREPSGLPSPPPSLSATIQTHERVRKDLVKRGRKLRDLAGSHIQLQRQRIITNKGKIIKININSRVAGDAAFFHEMQPNYSRPLPGVKTRIALRSLAYVRCSWRTASERRRKCQDTGWTCKS